MPRYARLRRCLLPALAGAILAWFGTGCAPAKPTPAQKSSAQNNGDDHDHGKDHDHDHGDHAHPETLATGIAELEATAAEIATKLASGAEAAADDAVHAAGHLLEDLQRLLEQQTDLSADARATGKKALDDLFDCFDKLDTAMHAGADEAKQTVADVHASVKQQITGALDSLKDTFSREAK
jgi:molecular chaperone GrpE (heat shock protein)